MGVPQAGAVGVRRVRNRPEGSPPSVPRRVRVLALLLAVGVLLAAHHLRPAPYGDHLTVGHTRVADGEVIARGAAVEAYDRVTGGLRWRYARAGHRPLDALHAREAALALWDDGTVTAVAPWPHAPAVRWHRTLPAGGHWLPAQGGTGVLRPLGHGILAVVTPDLVLAYRLSDGDLRWTLPATEGCAFAPARGMRHSGALLLAQPCADDAWTAQVVALDDLGRIAPHRTPLGNDRPVGRTGVREAGKALARPR
ncbi:hypothetical protein [Streptomyces sp. NPDC087294]|uniref:hypothetical protein n=1 Tax=Streptomyces sp. NPDC087294 TaxID=3365777 RepID=UPI003820B0A0